MLELDFHKFPVLETERLVLRRTLLSDAEDFLTLRSDVDVMRYIDRPSMQTIEEIFELIERIEHGIINNEAIGWAITLKGKKKLVGSIGFHRVEKTHYRAEVGYILSPHLWNNGIMSEALKAVLEYGFNRMKLHSIEAHVNPSNNASINLLSKFNFKREGYFKENFYFDGRFRDTAVYSLLRKQSIK